MPITFLDCCGLEKSPARLRPRTYRPRAAFPRGASERFPLSRRSSGSLSRSRSRSRSRRRRSPSRSRSRPRAKLLDRPPLIAPTLALLGRPASIAPSGELSRSDREKVVCFFDGTEIPNMLLEASTASATANDILDEHPFSFGWNGLGSDDVQETLDVTEDFTTPGGASLASQKAKSDQEERSIEIRQMISVNAQGQRCLRKALFVNGVRVDSASERI
eukprot:TRINITY_DN57853_c0_g1_i1.p1 TRINITY_DN57853_c0_g1~~TRINITY_DN57853_c0_g1_i1.p1  ORF type:complete len:218 (+),score=17.66 TRINITY_DN57853_c0_g1_i1:40-693(+)